jgi:hypothetical protein
MNSFLFAVVGGGYAAFVLSISDSTLLRAFFIKGLGSG